MTSLDALREALAARYELREELGRGGMATVYLARDLRHDRSVAVKVLRAGLTAAVGTRRFESEIRTTAALHHPHILPLFDSGEAAGHLYYVMPVVEGESLEDRLHRQGTLAPAEAVAVAEAAASALHYAHERGVVHRDVKPANILLHVGQTVIADFGISLAADAEARLTTEGVWMGSPHYMSPEQIAGEADVDARADQYSLACTFFEMVEGRPPFRKRSARAVLAAHLVEGPPSITRAGHTSDAFTRVLHRAMAKRPDDRFRTVAEFAATLRQAVSAPQAPASGAPDVRAGLVVLPFANLSPDPDNEYFSDGLTEEVIADLTHVRSLRVISRTSSMRLKQDERDVETIARDLNVRYVLEGGVRKAGDALRITARLIDTPSGDHVWADRFDGTMDDVFEIQERVAREVVAGLRVQLSPAEDRAIADRPLEDHRAYEAYLRARYEVWRFSLEGADRARRHIQVAESFVGENEMLYSILGLVGTMYAELGIEPDPELPGVAELADRIFSLNPESPRGFWLRSFDAFQRGDLATAIESGERGLELAPQDPDTLVLLTYVYAHVGRTGRARQLVEHVLWVDPLTPITQIVAGFVEIVEGNMDEGVGRYRRARDMDPESPMAAVCYGWALVYARQRDRAIEALDSAADRFPGGPFPAWARSLARAVEGDHEGVARAVTPEIQAAARGSEMFARALANVYSLAGEIDVALDWLERAVELGLWNEPFLTRHDWTLEPLRDEPRFRSLVERIRDEVARIP